MKSNCLVWLILAACVSASCNSGQSIKAYSATADTIDISEVTVALPEGDGKEDVEKSCVPCHSLRYIQMQPNMPRKDWNKTVTKMIKVYGAPVKDSITAAKITDYLALIKGTNAH